MNFLELVKQRCSVRKYEDRPVSRELLDRCLEAARLAPSACNSQPWSFIVIDDPARTRAIVPEIVSGIYKLNTFAVSAPVLIVVITEYSTYAARLGGMVRNVKYNLIDIGIACDHLTLQAAELGLGTCWLGWFNEKKLKKQLGLPRSTRIDVVLSLGYPAPDTEPREKIRKPLEHIRRYLT